ncbi:putative CDK4/6 [Trametes coccinea BRFM310]|uniref:Putative CDK4/6 n=1 Tax=Trametes coccinea (strain BRFM310) TaxID=1353009 RepID=A0A1Y2IAF6_TRAC3|nr:putative CDK4/6 [Trametes coccinea BRFM310]
MLAPRQLGRLFRSLTTRGRRPPSPPRPLSTAEPPLIDPSYLVEEETIPWYDPNDFYPVDIGEVLQARYQVIGKLGFGGYSTVWLCRDLVEHRYVAVKVCAQNSVPIKRELAALQHLNSLPETHHLGRDCIRPSLDHFELVPDDTKCSHVAERPFYCIVYEPMAMSVWSYRKVNTGKRLPLPLAKGIAERLLHGLDYLHCHANLVHADIQEQNILFHVNDPAAFGAFEERERTNPSQRKVTADRTIYTPRGIHIRGIPGRPVLSDFGEARFGQESYTGVIQPVPYRAPEVMFGTSWDAKVDIWSVGVMMWDIVEGKPLIRTLQDAEAETEPPYDEQLSHIVALLGPPPADFLERCPGERTSKYFDAQGNWIGDATVPDDSFEKAEERLEGEEKANFLDFVRQMVRWKPEDRLSASELLKHAWLRS